MKVDMEKGSWIDIPTVPSKPLEATIFVAASNARKEVKAMADLVASGSNDDLIIEQAINMLPPAGGTVKLSEGEFILGSSIDISRSNVVLEGCGFSTVLKTPSEGDCIKITDTNSVKISDLKIDGAAQVGGGGIFIQNSNRVIVTNCLIYNTFEAGIKASNTTLSLFEGNIIDSIRSDGISVYYLVNSSIIGNVICNSQGSGIYLSDSSQCLISGNSINNSAYIGIYLFSTSDCGIEGNSIIDCNYDGIHCEFICFNCSITGNQISSSGSNGIYCNACGSFAITGNQILITYNTGIYLLSSDHFTITGNQIRDAGLDGIAIFYSNYCVVSGNQIFNSPQNGIAMDNSYFCSITGNEIHITGYNGITNYESYDCSIVGNVCEEVSPGYYTVWNNYPNNIISSNSGNQPIHNEGNNCIIIGNRVPTIVCIGLDCLVMGNITG
ncbi:MAG: right-handed parallel beta-helix repeat-containing protein [Candidatus Methanomethylicaceae archaeon]